MAIGLVNRKCWGIEYCQLCVGSVSDLPAQNIFLKIMPSEDLFFMFRKGRASHLHDTRPANLKILQSFLIL